MTEIVGIIGATGAVGREVIHLLDELKFPVKKLRLFASERSAGKTIQTPYGSVEIEEYTLDAARQTDILFLAVSGEFAKENARKLAAEGGPKCVIDNSSALRLEKDVPLIIPEINGHCLKNSRLIANPNCTTAIALMALHPINTNFGIKKLIISTYQAASGAGAEGMEELVDQTRIVVNNQTPNKENEGAFDLTQLKPKVFKYPLAFNLIPQIDVFQENGYTKEEMKVVWETKKIFEDQSLNISCTCVRIPTMRAHSEAITVETFLPITPDACREIIGKATGVKVVDNPSKFQYPMPLHATRQYDVEAGRFRQSLVYGNYGVDFFVCGDQLYRGAALNAVYIAQQVLKNETLPNGNKKKWEVESMKRIDSIGKYASSITIIAGLIFLSTQLLQVYKKQ